MNSSTAALVLASASPRRQELLAECGIPHRIIISNVEEVENPLHLTGVETAQLNAVRKARAVAFQKPGGWVLGADTVVDLEGTLLAKPLDLHHAWRMLRMLSGRTHLVATGVALYDPCGQLNHSFVDCTRVTFHDLSDAEIGIYIQEVNPLDKAGAYGAQESTSVRLIRAIDGALSTVYGLPMERLTPLLHRLVAHDRF